MSEDAEQQNKELESLARSVKPIKGRSKRGKKFADMSFMLSLADQINKREEEKFQTLLQEEAKLLKLVAKKNAHRTQRVRAGKRERLEELKRKLRTTRGSTNSNKEDHRRTTKDNKKAKSHDKKTVRFR